LIYPDRNEPKEMKKSNNTWKSSTIYKLLLSELLSSLGSKDFSVEFSFNFTLTDLVNIFLENSRKSG
jgi:hypothetical protein